MLIPVKDYQNTLIVDHSRFIAFIFPTKDIDEFDSYLNKLKEEHNKATHFLYAYVINELKKSNNDNEPGNIARDFLDLINLKKINKIGIIVVRYFGGTKLGASRLFRTYHTLVNDALNLVKLEEEKNVYQYDIECDFNTLNKLKKAGYLIENVKYLATIKLVIISNLSIKEELKRYGVISLKEKFITRVI